MSSMQGRAEQPLHGTVTLDERVRFLVHQGAFAALIDEALDHPEESVGNDANSAEAREKEWRANRFLFVTGPHASGKSAVAKAALPPEQGFVHFDTGPILRDYHHSDAPHTSFGQWVSAQEMQYGPHFTDELLAYHISVVMKSAEHSSGVVVIGNRSVGGVAYLQDRLAPSDSRVLYTDAPVELLFARYKMREGEGDMTLDQFIAILAIDSDMGLLELDGRADVRIMNQAELDNAAQQLRQYVDAWHPQPTTG